MKNLFKRIFGNIQPLFCLIILLQLGISCSNDRLPYEYAFEKAVIANTKIEPIVEMLTIDSQLDSARLKKYYRKELHEKKVSHKAEAKVKYDKAKEKYNQSLKSQGKDMADAVYLGNVNEAKVIYDRLQEGVIDSVWYESYYERVRYPTTWEEITVKYRLAKDGPLLVERYRTDIFKGDTSFYALEEGAKISDFIK